jgi:hypothetical protein
MKQTMDNSMFRSAFESMNRTDNFSYKSLDAMFDYFEEMERDTGVEMELDVIAICCDYQEFENVEQFNSEYGTEYESYEEIDETAVIPVDDYMFVIQSF